MHIRPTEIQAKTGHLQVHPFIFVTCFSYLEQKKEKNEVDSRKKKRVGEVERVSTKF